MIYESGKNEEDEREIKKERKRENERVRKSSIYRVCCGPQKPPKKTNKITSVR